MVESHGSALGAIRVRDLLVSFTTDKLSHPVSLVHFRVNPGSSHFLPAVVSVVLRMSIKPQSLFFVQLWIRLRLFAKVVLLFMKAISRCRGHGGFFFSMPTAIVIAWRL